MRFELTVTDRAGESGTDEVEVCSSLLLAKGCETGSTGSSLIVAVPA